MDSRVSEPCEITAIPLSMCPVSPGAKYNTSYFYNYNHSSNSNNRVGTTPHLFCTRHCARCSTQIITFNPLCVRHHLSSAQILASVTIVVRPIAGTCDACHRSVWGLLGLLCPQCRELCAWSLLPPMALSQWVTSAGACKPSFPAGSGTNWCITSSWVPRRIRLCPCVLLWLF